MDISRDKPTGTDGTPYIWLRYTTQFTTGGRTHTIEMGIPVPVGASAEMREQLIREAEMGMEQLSRRVESRVSQMLQRGSRPPETARTQESSATRQAQAPQQGSAAGMPAAAGTQPASPAPPQQPAAAPVRQSQSVAANMPVTPGIQGDNMKLSQFLQVIRETWELSPKEAMDLLRVKNLNGMNYREALRELQVRLGEKAGDTNASMQAKNRPVSSQPKPASSTPPVSPARPGGEAARGTQATTGGEKAGLRDVKGPAQSVAATPAPAKPAAPTPPVRPAPGALAGPAHIPVIPIRDEMVREAPKVFKFDEEDEEIEEGEGMKSEAQMAIARIKLDELKEVRGASVASPGRLMVLHNVLNSQISDEQLQRVIQSAWGATSVKKLKVDQVEALISWAKEDNFLDEVEDVLDLIDEEESYARSDR